MVPMYSTRWIVGDDVIDINEHVNNLAYVGWMQDVATAHSVERGWPLERYRELGSGWFARTHHVDYLRPAFLRDVLVIRTWVAAMTARTSTRRYLFVRESDGATVVSAETLWVYVDFATGRPTRIAPQVASSFTILGDDDPQVLALTKAVKTKPRGVEHGNQDQA